MGHRDIVGKYKIGVCGTTPCMLCGAQNIMDTIKDYLKIDLHGIYNSNLQSTNAKFNLNLIQKQLKMECSHYLN